jgi:undecaprenyl-diphosphatase
MLNLFRLFAIIIVQGEGFMNIFDILRPFDTAIIDFINNNLKCPVMDFLMMIFSYAGVGGIIWLVPSIIMVFFKKTRAMGIMVICAMTIGFLIGELGIKNLVLRPRPYTLKPDIVLNISFPTGTSFPSGHSCSSFAAATIMRAKDKKLGIPALIVASLIAFSRLYNYVHYLSDVLGGIALGIICAFVVIFIFRKTGLEEKISNCKLKRVDD